MKKIVLCILFPFLPLLQVKASDFVGAEISYKHISGNTYEIRVTSFIEYISNPIIRPNLTVNYRNNCTMGSLQLQYDTNYASNIACSLIDPHVIIEYKTQFTFAGLNCNGVELTLDAPCCMPVYNNLQSPSPIEEVKAEILYFSRQNTSAEFNTSVIKFAQKNSTTDIDLSASDINGDSLVYTLADASGTYASGYTFNDPFGPNGTSILNPSTGVLTVTPTAIGTYLINVLVSEYKNGNLAGTSQREWAIDVIDNVATNHNPSLSGINNTTNYSISACIGDTVSFFASITDLDTNQNVLVKLLTTLPFSKLTTVGRTINFKWILNSSITPGVYHPKIQLNDQNCGVTTSIFNITVNPCISTTVDEPIPSVSFTFYPNPSSGNILLNLNPKSINTIISLRSITGSLIKEIQITNDQQELDLSDLENGIYFISIPTSKGVLTKKIILTK
ncbi:T9SS type A sorting domain-containing protein [Acidiluteibacter ferrifornacis]|uniref:T9SS type A sorting domain-containing protein n=1 Tax=Acidiluteibacter ferrifornacis TaxID=2692424 RepID=A0A6N9NJE6_9FLAO|nr:T9SS type A sorting domain-containing protein [Acidiluteibacter ferrifornacis]MBR9831633.1 T9SS type A sorting domain-containing protein [bacterium]NBG65984.1 T9SS type A sorting domain-containing protein [Acidiluteibacter ferrifornacis]